MQLWSRGIPGGLVDAVSWPVVCNHSPTSHFVKGIHHWRQKSNLQAAMSIWAIGFKWAIPRKCHAFLGLGVFKTTVLVGEYFLNLFTSFGSSNWSRKHILRHIGILYHVFVHDGMIYLYSSPEPFSTLFSLHARVFSSMNCNIRNVLKPNPSLFLILTYHYSCHLKNTQFNLSANPNLGCQKTQGLGRNQQIRELSSDVGLQGSQGAPAPAGETPGPSRRSYASMTSGGPGEPSKCCGCNTFAVQIEGVVGMPCQRVCCLLLMIWQRKNWG